MKLLPVLVNKYSQVTELVERIKGEGTMYTYDFETLGNRPKKLKVAGLGLAFGSKPGQGGYIVTEHQGMIALKWEKVLEIVQPLLEDSRYTAVAHNQLFDGTILDIYGVKMHTNTYDTMVMNWLLNTETTNGLKDIILRMYGHQMNELTKFVGWETVDWHPGKILRLDKAPIDVLAQYAIEDVLWTYRLAVDEIAAIKDDARLDKIYHKLYQRYLLVLSAMEADGIQIDTQLLATMEADAHEILIKLEAELQAARAGQDFDPSEMFHVNRLRENATAAEREAAINADRKLIPELNAKWKDRKNLRQMLYDTPHLAHKVYNLNSNNHLNKILFEELKLKPIGDKTKMDLYQLDAKVLLKIQNQDSTGFVKKYMEYNKIHKLHSVYLSGMQPLIDDDSRLRTSFNPALKTGRLSSRAPNLQNIIHDKRFPVRAAFVAPYGKKLIVLDYSQMELRILAHSSQDVTLVEGFKAGFDPHSLTTIALFDLDCPVEDVAKLHPQKRKVGKLMNFAVVYGVGARSLVEQIIDMTNGESMPTEKDAQGFIDKIFTEMPGIKNYLDQQYSNARKFGVVRTLIGRPRHLPDAQQRTDRKKYFGAMRRAGNTPIQGSAADIIGLAMCNIADRMTEMGYWRTRVKMCLQVHDELVFEVDEEIAAEVLPIMEHEMKNAITLRVPLDADGGIGDDWNSAKAA